MGAAGTVGSAGQLAVPSLLHAGLRSPEGAPGLPAALRHPLLSGRRQIQELGRTGEPTECNPFVLADCDLVPPLPSR